MTVRVPLRNRAGEIVAHALVDDADRSLVEDRRWYLDAQGYPATGRHDRLHRLLLSPIPSGREVDHRNRDKLDNRRANLRVVTHRTNTRNIGSRRANLPLGVYVERATGVYFGQVKRGGRKYHAGRHTSVRAAADAVATLRAALDSEET